MGDRDLGQSGPLLHSAIPTSAPSAQVGGQVQIASAGPIVSREKPQLHDQNQRQRRVACRDCRQAKLRCEGLDSNGRGLCTRCKRLSLECQVDYGYKRANKRVKLNELQEQLEQLRSEVSRRGTSNTYGTNPDRQSGLESPQPVLDKQPSIPHQNLQLLGHDTQHSVDHSISSSNTFTEPQPTREEGANFTKDTTLQSAWLPQSEEIFQSSSFPSSSSRSLEHVELSREQIRHLFCEFFKHYHHLYGILDPSISPDECYDRSTLLFWSIISIAARRYEEDGTLLASLAPCVKRLMWSTISVPPYSRFAVQAILLLSMWSFPTNSMSTDISFIAVSVAKSASMQLGLHRPETLQDFLRVQTRTSPQEFQDAVKVWAGCYIAAHSITSSIGQPSFFPSDWTIYRACELGSKYTLPEGLRHELLIHTFIARVNAVMGENNNSPSGYPSVNESVVLMAMLERDYTDLDRQISHKLTVAHEILFATAGLQLRTYYLFMTSNSDVRKQGLLKAYAISLTLISKAVEADDKWNFMQYAHGGYAQGLTIAGLLLMKILNSSYSLYIDIEKGKKAFSSVLTLLRKASVEDNDLRGRVSKILAQLWGVHRSSSLRREQEPSLRIKSRWGASLLHDSLWIWREEFGGQAAVKSNSANAPSVPTSRQQTSEPFNISEDERQPENRGAESVSSQSYDVAQGNAANGASAVSDGIDDFAAGPQDCEWIWDIGFPALVPIDLDFPLGGGLLSGQNGGECSVAPQPF